MRRSTLSRGGGLLQEGVTCARMDQHSTRLEKEDVGCITCKHCVGARWFLRLTMHGCAHWANMA
eukprot:3291238-Prorocentrum_lima.AAC.1